MNLTPAGGSSFFQASRRSHKPLEAWFPPGQRKHFAGPDLSGRPGTEMTTTDELILLAGVALLAALALVLLRWRRVAIRTVVPPDKLPPATPVQVDRGRLTPAIKAELLSLLVQRPSRESNSRRNGQSTA